MIKNCTPHDIEVRVDNCGITEVTIFQRSEIIPRVETIETVSEEIEGFPTVRQTLSEVSGLPPFQYGTFLIVSGMVFNASDRADLIAPDTGKTAIRNEKGQIVAVTRFLRKEI